MPGSGSSMRYLRAEVSVDSDENVRTFTTVTGLPIANGQYSYAAMSSSGSTVSLAGQVSIDSDGDVVGVGDIHRQTTQVYQNIGRVLDAAGCSFADVLLYRVFLTSREHIDGFTTARELFFRRAYPRAGYPASTVVIVSALIRHEFLVEIETLARSL